jgi:uncharacterized protein (DUF697 family)
MRFALAVARTIHTQEPLMHDLDRTQLEMENDEFEQDEFESDEFESDEFESDEFEAAAAYRNEFEFEHPFNEADEMELAAELLTVGNEFELDQFLGRLIKRAGRSIGKAVRSPLGKQLGAWLRAAAKKALPTIAGAAGGLVGGPAGAALSSSLAGKASQLFGLELEGLSGEDQEFEVARRFVRFAGSAVQNADTDAEHGMEGEVARSAVVAAAQRHAPGFVRSTSPRDHRSGRRAQSGRWIRRHGRIILLGI